MATYDSFSETFAKSRDSMRWPEMTEFIASLSGKEKILDLGCGSGRFLQQYIEHFGFHPPKYLGIDQSAGMILEAQKRHDRHLFCVGDMTQLSLEANESYDIIVCFASFHHLMSVDARQNALSLMGDILRKDGMIFMTNWALSSDINSKKYMNSRKEDSKNEFGNFDYAITFGDTIRMYHDFSQGEMQSISHKAHLQLVYHHLHRSGRNYITQLSKKSGAS